MPRARLVFDGDGVYTEKEARIHKLTQETETKIDNIPGVVDDVNSTSTTDALSANMGKRLQDQINQLTGLNKFLSTWDCTTGLPVTDPSATPFTYTSGNYYLVATVAGEGGTNYKPHGNTFTPGVASTAVETNGVNVNDMYIFDGSQWILQVNKVKEIIVDDGLDPESTNAVENRAIYLALTTKQDKILDLADIRDGATKGATSIQPLDNITELTNNAGYQTAGDVAVAIDEAIDGSKYVGPTAPSNPTEGMLWYDTTNDQLKVYDGTQWNVTGKEYVAGTGISISGTTISNTGVISSNNTYNNVIHLTQAEYDALQNKDPNTLYSTPDGNDISVVSNEAYSANWDGINTTAPSKNAVYDKISAMDVAISGLSSDINTKTFTISNTGSSATVLAEAQAAYDWFHSGKNVIIYYGGNYYFLGWIDNTYLGFYTIPFYMNGASYDNINILELKLNKNANSDVITSVTENDVSRKYLDTNKNYPTVYTPQYDGSPATKKYVDDTVFSATTGSKYVGPTAPSNPTEGMLWYDTTNGVLKAYDGTSWNMVGNGDMSYNDFNFQTKTGASVTLSLNSTITPSANFTINAPSEIKDGQTYILRVNNGATAYTMTLGTNITNPYNTDTTLTADGVDQFMFLAVGGNLELQPDLSEILRAIEVLLSNI